jgi:hypothetical protein
MYAARAMKGDRSLLCVRARGAFLPASLGTYVNGYGILVPAHMLQLR